MENDVRILLECIASGDGEAYRLLFRRWYPKVKVFLARFLGDDNVAEDLAQDIFVRIWTFGPALTEIRDFDSYIFKMTRNTALNYVRDRKIGQEITSVTIMDDLDIEDVYSVKEKELIIRLQVEQMPPQRQRVFKMSRQQGLSNEKIAEILGVSKRTVENHLTDALRSLREVLAV